MAIFFILKKHILINFIFINFATCARQYETCGMEKSPLSRPDWPKVSPLLRRPRQAAPSLADMKQSLPASASGEKEDEQSCEEMSGCPFLSCRS